ncbi:HsdR family type I site-specific deoxyribonuclease [Zeaxanthinibacter sp. PT1]|uniref:type I restriction endonuclease subunit R n=1 Tax=Zeaxanthinibacter TaxID=561554 RepID=UPI00234A6797|nr:HsdR family type I site-specific deoxyribonuclease [Zeaxanthinibacter sp. PT1]MDC6350469.1 HsdR family type I site-specific deoxyribonuclease [Zeaxanthinibacter sp. PT1]
MYTPSFREDHISQVPALQFLINLGYTYLTPNEALELRGGKKSQVLLEPILKKQLREMNVISRKGREYKFSESNINSAVLALKDLPIQEGFLYANAAFYDLITLGKAMEQSIHGDKKSHTLQYVDWENPENNTYHVSEEFSVLREGRSDTYRPDIILFVNGIPMVVIECKSPALRGTKSPTELAVEQHLRNFSKDGIRSLYHYSNLLLSIATNDGSYGTTGTSKEFWAKWKEQFRNETEEEDFSYEITEIKNQPLSEEQKRKLFSDRTFGFHYAKRYFDGLEQEERTVTKQDELLYSLCRPERLLDLMRNFIVYDAGIKKIARYQQYFAVGETLERVSGFNNSGKREGGVIWHTQGSGKSLTMVMLAQLLATSKEITNPKILLVTDRIDLDDQISDTFKKCQKEVKQAKTGKHLTELLQDKSDAIITTIINKFEAAVNQCKQPFLSADIFVLVDEGHRTQYGSFNVSMRRVFPNACFLAFTGTPLMKKEKSTAQKFGGYIGIPYTVKDAVEDGAVVPLLYEGRHNKMTVDEDPINRYFDKLAEPLSEYGKANLKRKVNTVNELNKTEKIIYARAWDISEHYKDFFQTEGDAYKPKAQLVAPSIKAALRYKKHLDEIGLVSSEVIVTRSDQREGTEDGFYNVNEDKRLEDEYFEAMIDKYGDLEKFEKNVISNFKKREHPEIIIVVAKLLTGFDAPRNTILYLCRSLKEHTLLQAIARVNRVYPGKDYGYIIDYYGNLENLDSALSTYSGLAGFEEEELEGTLTKVSEITDQLPQAHSELWDVFASLKGRNLEATAYEEYLAPEDIRNRFYEKLSAYSRLLKVALASVEYVTNTPQDKIDRYKKDARFFLKLRVDVKRRYNDDLSYKEFEPQIQKLINNHISTEGDVLKITGQVDIFNKEAREAEVEKVVGKAAKADHIASRTIKAISMKMEDDPIYYKKLSQLIKETIEAYHQKRIEEAEYLKRARQLEEKFHHGRSDDAPEALKGKEAALAFYNFSKDAFDEPDLLKTDLHEKVSLTVEEVILKKARQNGSMIVGWDEPNKGILGEITIDAGDRVYELLKEHRLDVKWEVIDKLVDDCLKVAVRKFQ